MTMGAAQSILATGLAGPGVRDDVIGVIVGGLTAGKDVAEVAGAVHRLGRPESLTEAIACLATAVFLERPPFSLFPVWAS
jgi:hypothetical protein